MVDHIVSPIEGRVTMRIYRMFVFTIKMVHGHFVHLLR